jgi:hypothetical protein
MKKTSGVHANMDPDLTKKHALFVWILLRTLGSGSAASPDLAQDPWIRRQKYGTGSGYEFYPKDAQM